MGHTLAISKRFWLNFLMIFEAEGYFQIGGPNLVNIIQSSSKKGKLRGRDIINVGISNHIIDL